MGETEDLETRIIEHNEGVYTDAFTKRASDWELFYSLTCNNRTQARKIESHIKNMKSRKYYKSLSTYPDLALKLLEKYK